jgi:hypothetical protein
VITVPNAMFNATIAADANIGRISLGKTGGYINNY